MNNHKNLYSQPEIYEQAFSYRDYPNECEFLSSVHERWGTNVNLERFLEVAAGPADHALELARRGIVCSALDLAPTMVQHGRKKAKNAGLALDYLHGDMVDFTSDRSFQLVACLLNSFSYLLSNADVLCHLDAVAEVLEPSGLYVMELSHPSELFGCDITKKSWTVQSDKGEVTTLWTRLGDYDPLTLVADFRVSMKFTSVDGALQEFESRGRQRFFTLNELHALVQASGRFEIVEVLGKLDVNAQITSPGEMWRMIPILRKS